PARSPRSPATPPASSNRVRPRWRAGSERSPTRESAVSEGGLRSRAPTSSPGTRQRSRTPSSSPRSCVTEPLFSVVIPTHKRPGDLARCLEALALLEDSVDVLVVDSAPDPPLASIVGRFPG